MISEATIEKVKDMYNDGYVLDEIIKETGVSESTIYRYVDRKNHGRYNTKPSKVHIMQDMVIAAYLDMCSPAEIEARTKFTKKFIDTTIKTFEEAKGDIIPDDKRKRTVTRNMYNRIVKMYLNDKSAKEIGEALGLSEKCVIEYVRKYSYLFGPGKRGRGIESAPIKSIEKETEDTTMSTSTPEKITKSNPSPVCIGPDKKECIVIDIGEGQRIEVTGNVSEFAQILNKLKSGDASLKDITDIGKYLNETTISIYEMEEVPC